MEMIQSNMTTIIVMVFGLALIIRVFAKGDIQFLKGAGFASMCYVCITLMKGHTPPILYVLGAVVIAIACLF